MSDTTHFDITETNEMPGPVAYWHDGAVWLLVDDPGLPYRIADKDHSGIGIGTKLPEGAVPLIPHTALDEATATIAELREWAEDERSRRRTMRAERDKAQEKCDAAARRVVLERDEMEAKRDRLTTERDALLAKVAELQEERSGAVELRAVDESDVVGVWVEGSPLPEPDATNPEHCRFSADVVEGISDMGWTLDIAGDDVGFTLRAEADRLESAAAQADILEQVAQIAKDKYRNAPWGRNVFDDIAQALAEAGLLRTQGGE